MNTNSAKQSPYADSEEITQRYGFPIRAVTQDNDQTWDVESGRGSLVLRLYSPDENVDRDRRADRKNKRCSHVAWQGIEVRFGRTGVCQANAGRLNRWVAMLAGAWAKAGVQVGLSAGKRALRGRTSPGHTQVEGGVNPRIRIQFEGGDVRVRWVAGAKPDRLRRGRCGWPEARSMWR